MSRVEVAREIADGAVSAVIDVIRDSIKGRRDNALWWHRFHAAMAAYHRVGWRWHRWQARRYRAMVLANMPAVCASQLV